MFCVTKKSNKVEEKNQKSQNAKRNSKREKIIEEERGFEHKPEVQLHNF